MDSLKRMPQPYAQQFPSRKVTICCSLPSSFAIRSPQLMADPPYENSGDSRVIANDGSVEPSMDVSVRLRLLFTSPAANLLHRYKDVMVSIPSPSNKVGPAARQGFKYQDHIAVAFTLKMLRDSTYLQVECETADDIVAVSENAGETVTEYIQVLFTLQVLLNLIPKRLGSVGFTWSMPFLAAPCVSVMWDTANPDPAST